MTGWRRLAAVAALASLGIAAAPPACAQAKRAAAGASAAAAGTAVYAERFRTVCAACHGTDGRGDIPGTPVLAGQYSLYTITQLFLFREGRRNNDAMVALAKQMKDADLRGFSDFIGTLPAVPAPPPSRPLDAARMSKGQTLAQQHKCTFCHGTDLAGGQQVPRIGGQKEDYLLMTLQGFKSGDRPEIGRAHV